LLIAPLVKKVIHTPGIVEKQQKSIDNAPQGASKEGVFGLKIKIFQAAPFLRNGGEGPAARVAALKRPNDGESADY
jgi:hypothetical protein